MGWGGRGAGYGGGKGSGWSCHQCGYANHYSSNVCVECNGYGYQEWGKGKKGKGDYPPYQGKGDYPPHQVNPYIGKGRGQDGDRVTTQRQRLGLMRQMLKNAETLGHDDKAEVLREEIKEQLYLSNEECGITREEQSVICLQQVKWKNKEKKDFKKAMIYHQQKTDLNAREYQKRRIEIKALYAELEDLGWNQIISEDDHEDYQSSDDGEAYMRANANILRRVDRERETPEERRARRARNIHGQPAVVDISDEDNMDVDGRAEQAAQARAAAPQAAAPQAAAPQAAPQTPIEPGSVEAARAYAMRVAQELAAGRAV
jgi:hypothetical protein